MKTIPVSNNYSARYAVTFLVPLSIIQTSKCNSKQVVVFRAPVGTLSFQKMLQNNTRHIVIQALILCFGMNTEKKNMS